MNQEQFRKEANKYCYQQLGFECFDEDDTYDCERSSPLAIDIHTPHEFVHTIFYDEFSDIEYTRNLENETYGISK